ncbi:glycosyltransferase [Dyadobacter sp. CY261]|uniref:glycosyltransferase family 2 protein n=1 Tax=Dyadobacter sp. CY261 TaxID=2907203 RepID=UPI001F1E4C1F|nr:glycosyltransferase family 2 protein [Dyadobacter sp. CY261]MCF0074491.1 glycosyltransferase [Dyadobacter sp. CY261]
MNQPKISIITVCFNSESTISETIESVLNQDFGDFEYILVDGGSKDNTLNIIAGYADKFHEKGLGYSFRSEPDRGIYDAMNKGISKARGELIGIINSDDWYELSTLGKVWKAYSGLEEKCNTVIYGMIRLWKQNMEYAIRRYHHNFVTTEVIQHPTCFVPKVVYEKYGMFNPDFRVCGDFDLLNRLHANNVAFNNIDEVLTNFRIGGATSLHTLTAAAEGLEVKRSFGTIGEEEYKAAIWRIKLRKMLRKYFRRG